MLNGPRRMLYTVNYVLSPRKPLLVPRLAKIYLKALVSPRKVLRGVDIVLGYECNLSCAHCNIAKMRKKAAPRLTIDDYRRLKRELDSLSVFSYTFTGGEPMLFGNLDEIIRLFEPSRNVMILQTNATLLNRENLKHLKRAGIDIVDVSLDSMDAENHDKGRGRGGTFEKALEAIYLCKELGLSPVAETVASHENLHTKGFRDLIDFSIREKIILLINLAVPVGAWKGNTDILLTPDDVAFIRSLIKRHPNIRSDFESNFFAKGCPAVKEKLYISPYGDVLGCTFVQISFGNVREESIVSIREKAMQSPLLNEYHPYCPAAENKQFIDRYLSQVNESKNPPVFFGDLL